jgi:DNA-binding helix-hairpin-helix protein with protein kinase domain
LEKAFEEIKQRTETARRSERELRDVVNTVPATGGLNGSSSLENFTKRIDFRTNFLAAVTLSTSMKYVRVENNHRGAFRICARTPPKG